VSHPTLSSARRARGVGQDRIGERHRCVCRLLRSACSIVHRSDETSPRVIQVFGLKRGYLRPSPR
jgi:hypothetical protein